MSHCQDSDLLYLFVYIPLYVRLARLLYYIHVDQPPLTRVRRYSRVRRLPSPFSASHHERMRKGVWKLAQVQTTALSQ